VSKAIAWVVAGALVAAVPACRRVDETGPSQRIKLLSRVVVAESSRALVARYNRSIPGIQSVLEIIPGSEYVVNALQDGEAELGFAQADVVYTAYRTGTAGNRTPYEDLRAIAVGQRASVFPVVREAGGVRTLAGLRGKRVGLDPTGSYGEVYARMVLKAYGLDEGDVTLTHLLPDGLAAGIRDGTLDAAMFVGPSPLTIARLIQGTAIRVHFPFMTPTVIAAAALPAGAVDTHTVGVDNVLVCRGDLTEDLVYQLTAGLFAESDRMQQQDLAAPPWIDIERAPATPVPLHPGAARYYRERQILQ
jgi:TRAP transporter TAXI family solute receptor